MLEEALCIAHRQRIERPAHRFYARLAGTSIGLAQRRLELGECFFYGVKI
jgi:hypothetical protein